MQEGRGGEDVGASLARRFRSRSAVYLSADVLVKVLAVGLFLLTVQTFGPELFGRLSRVSALVGIAAAVGDFGLVLLLLRRVGGLAPGAELPRDEWRLYVLLRTGLTAVTVVACVAYLAAVGATRDVVVAAAGGGASLLVRAFPDLVSSVLRGQGRTRPDFAVRIVSGVAYVAAGVLVVQQGFGVEGYAAAWLFSAVVAAVTSSFVSLRPAAPDAGAAAAVPARSSREILRDALPFGILAICMVVYFRIDMEMLVLMRGDADAGIYGTAYRLFEVCLLVPAAASAALIPLFSGSLERGRPDEVRRLAADSVRTMAFLGGLGGVVMFTLGPLAIRHLRDDVGAAGGVFEVLVWTVPVIFVSSVVASAIAASAFARVNTSVAILMVAENVLLNLVWIPRWGPAGAAAATLVTEATGLVIRVIDVRRRLGGLPVGGTLVRMAAAIAAGAGASVGVGDAAGGWLAPPVGAAAFAGVWWVGSFAGRRGGSAGT